jgi:hypothetical protein
MITQRLASGWPVVVRTDTNFVPILYPVGPRNSIASKSRANAVVWLSEVAALMFDGVSIKGVV